METAAVVMMVEVMAVVPICPIMNGMPRVPPTRPITPVPRRTPAHPIRSPEPIIDNGSIDIHGLNDIILAIYILVTDNLYGYVIGFVFFHVDGRNVLIDVFGEHGLQHYQMFVAVGCFNDANIIDVTVAVEIQIDKSGIRIVEPLFEILQVFGLAE